MARQKQFVGIRVEPFQGLRLESIVEEVELQVSYETGNNQELLEVGNVATDACSRASAEREVALGHRLLVASCPPIGIVFFWLFKGIGISKKSAF